jgi:hypothetical protein
MPSSDKKPKRTRKAASEPAATPASAAPAPAAEVKKASRKAPAKSAAASPATPKPSRRATKKAAPAIAEAPIPVAEAVSALTASNGSEQASVNSLNVASTHPTERAPISETLTHAAAAGAGPDAPAATVTPTYEEIAHRAYIYWAERGYQGGSAEEDWLRAEHELTNGR